MKEKKAGQKRGERRWKEEAERCWNQNHKESERIGEREKEEEKKKKKKIQTKRKK